MSLKCTNANISAGDWSSCLKMVDDDCMGLQSDSNSIAIISCPFNPSDIQQSMTEYILNVFDNDSVLFCCDIIMEFIILNKHIIQQKIRSNKSQENNINNEWTLRKHDELLSTQSLIIIDLKNSNYISIPRNTNDLNSKWKISWTGSDEYNSLYHSTCSIICGNIANKYLPQHFISNDWSQRTDFNGVKHVGYLCDNGFIIKGDCLRQNRENGKIFVHFNTDAGHFGKNYEWLNTPNDRICPPPKQRPPPLNTQQNSYAPPTNYRHSFNVGAAMAASLRFNDIDNQQDHIYNEPISSDSAEYNDQQTNFATDDEIEIDYWEDSDNDDFFEKAVKAASIMDTDIDYWEDSDNDDFFERAVKAASIMDNNTNEEKSK